MQKYYNEKFCFRSKLILLCSYLKHIANAHLNKQITNNENLKEYDFLISNKSLKKRSFAYEKTYKKIVSEKVDKNFKKTFYHIELQISCGVHKLS